MGKKTIEEEEDDEDKLFLYSIIEYKIYVTLREKERGGRRRRKKNVLFNLCIYNDESILSNLIIGFSLVLLSPPPPHPPSV